MGTCKDDKNVPNTIYGIPLISYDKLEECCAQYYIDTRKAKWMNEKGYGLWFVAYQNKQCALDCEESNWSLYITLILHFSPATAQI